MDTMDVTQDERILMQYKANNDLTLYHGLFEKYRPLIYGVCLKYLQNAEDAEDCVHEIFMSSSKKAITHQIASFRPWLYVVAKNYCFDILRKKSRNFDKENEAFRVYSDQIFHPTDDEDEDEMRKLQNCMKSLSSEQYQVIHLFYFEKMSYQDISDQLSLGLGQIRSYIQNGRRNLKICMEKK